MSQVPRVLYCHCAYARVVPEDIKEAVLEGLTASELAFDTVADLCELAAKGDPALKQLAQAPCLKIAACYPRAVKWLFSAAEAPLATEGVEFINLRVLNAETALERLLAPELTTVIEAESTAIQEETA